jgi:DNA-binding CsgD family transcriptional regulator
MAGAITRRGLAAILGATNFQSGQGEQGLLQLATVLAAEAGAQSVAFFELDLLRSQETWYVGTDGDDVAANCSPEAGQLFWPLFWSGVCSYTEPGTPFAWPQSRYAVASPARLHGSRRAYAATADFEYDRQCELGDYIVVPLSSQSGITRRVLLNRSPGDLPFCEWDRTALRLLQPHLDVAAQRARICMSGASVLSRREFQVMTYVRAGHDNRTIARLLNVQPSTVRKHLENTYAHLGVHSRTAALAIVFGPVADAG